MISRLRNWLLAKAFIDGFKAIEKQNLVTKALEVAFKQEAIKECWVSFLNSVEELLKDGLDEVRQARSWK